MVNLHYKTMEDLLVFDEFQFNEGIGLKRFGYSFPVKVNMTVK